MPSGVLVSPKCDHIALVELSIPAKLEAKKAELHGKLLDKPKNDPSYVDSTLYRV